jgi:hypothetical protein
MCISEACIILRWFSGAYLMRSSGHILLSLLPISGWLNRSLISLLLFCAVRFLWFFSYVLMTWKKIGTRTSDLSACNIFPQPNALSRAPSPATGQPLYIFDGKHSVNGCGKFLSTFIRIQGSLPQDDTWHTVPLCCIFYRHSGRMSTVLMSYAGHVPNR